MDRRTLLKTLEQARQDEPVNIVSGCLQILKQAGQDAMGWVSRKPDRLDAIRHPRPTVACQRVYRDLIDFTISTVLACEHVDEFWTCLSVRETRHLSAEGLEKMQAGRLAARRSLEAARRARMAC